jgi:hypothetical protein
LPYNALSLAKDIAIGTSEIFIDSTASPSIAVVAFAGLTSHLKHSKGLLLGHVDFCILCTLIRKRANFDVN